MHPTRDDENKGEEGDAVTHDDDDDGSEDWIGNEVNADDGHGDTKENGGMSLFSA